MFFISQITGATPYFAAVFVGGLFIVVGVVSGDASGQYINKFSQNSAFAFVDDIGKLKDVLNFYS